jgi:NitT/TauT family transport system substrate-binding protein
MWRTMPSKGVDMKRRVAVALAMLMATSGCYGKTGENGGGPKITEVKTVHVTYATGFGAVGRDAFIWVARDKGYFRDVGIDIDIQKGAGNVPNLTLLKSGQAQFAAMDFSGAEVLAGTGKFTDWRAVAAVHQQTLVSIMTTAGTGITKPGDLPGKTIATASGSVSELLFPAYAKLAGFDPRTVKIQGTQPTALNSLMAQRKVDAISTFLLSKKALETASKKPVTVMPYSDYLKNLYGNVIVTRADVLATDRELVRRFTGAALKGLRFSIDHPDEAAAILNKAEPTAAIPAAVGEIKAMTPYAEPLGKLDQQRVADGIAELTSAGLMPPGLTPAQVADFGFVP